MASASKTPNLNLPQWLETEKPERTEFNAAFDAIDTTVASHLAEDVTDDVHGLLSSGKIIQEMGSNSKGSWIKFANGEMVCWGKKTVTIAVEEPYGYLYRTANDAITIEYPLPFIGVPMVTFDVDSSVTAWVVNQTLGTNVGKKVYLLRPTVTGQDAFDIHFCARGRSN